MIPQAISRRPGLTWVVVLSVIEMIALVIGIGSPGQPLLTGLFVLTCPGFLLLDLPNPRSLAARVMLGAGASLALNASLIAIDRAGYTLPVAAVLILALAIVAFLPRATLRRGISSIKSMVSRTEAGHTNPPAAADRLTPLYVDRQATTLVEPDPPTDGDLAPATDDEDLTEPLAADTVEAAQEQDEDEIPVQEEDEAPVQDEDEAPVQEEDETPAQLEDLPDQQEDEAPAQEEDTPAVATAEEAVPDQGEDETPTQEEDGAPAQEEDEDEVPAQDDEPTVQDEDEVPAQEDGAPAQEEDEIPAQDDDIPAVATAEDVSALLEELRAADDLYEVTSDQADVAASQRVAEDTPNVPDEEDISPVPASANPIEPVDDEIDARKEDSEPASQDEATASSPDEGLDTLEGEMVTTDEHLEVSEDDAPLVEAEDTAPPDEVVVESGEEDATPSAAAGVPTPDDVDMQPPSIVIFGVDINRAGPEAIAAFPGMEPEPAALIVAYRDRHGPFGDARELVRLLRAIEARQNTKRQTSGSR